MFAWGVAAVPLVEVRKMFSGPERGHFYPLFTRREMACCGGSSAVRSLERLAGRLAAKRAVLRALGLPADNPALWSTVEILPGPAGQPRVYLCKGTGRAISGEGLTVRVSISHGERLAVAIAVVA
ncbi:MAG TPA: ACP synthase [Desulfotomaculum sp.]|nr:ACP synthase [Desulfotomaculum sp.]